MVNFANIFGDPLTQWQLATTWPSVAEELITDNAYHSDLQPRNAPRWSLRSLFNEENVQLYCRYVELFRLFIQLGSRSSNNNPLLNLLLRKTDNQQQQQDEQDIRQALDRLSTSTSLKTTNTFLVTSQFLSDLMSMAVGTGSRQIPSEYIEAFVENLFDDNDDDREKLDKDTKPDVDDEDQLGNLKSASCDSLSYRLANLVVNIYGQTRQPHNLAQLWKFFLQKLRNHWISGRPLPHVTMNSIDHGSCQPQYLLSHSNRPIQVPQTQDPAPMTEDMLARQITNLAQIDDVRTKIRLQSAGLLSDMEAFKAANPG
ncbi:hypothetical protein BLA29_006082, partial [Euroglyphus maynei]